MVIYWTPSMKVICFRDLPSFIRTTDPDEFMLSFPTWIDRQDRVQKSSSNRSVQNPSLSLPRFDCLLESLGGVIFLSLPRPCSGSKCRKSLSVSFFFKRHPFQ
ncbi:hypothetical protein I3760_15G090000 [Carya illinoinensis]|nr:hypothetical protein I3760_15G090000 [Carya illinoinensis]